MYYFVFSLFSALILPWGKHIDDTQPGLHVKKLHGKYFILKERIGRLKPLDWCEEIGPK